MVKVTYVGTRACRADGVLWSKNDIREVPEDFYERYKNQGFNLVKEKKKIIKQEIKEKVIVEDFVGEEEEQNEKVINNG